MHFFTVWFNEVSAAGMRRHIFKKNFVFKNVFFSGGDTIHFPGLENEVASGEVI